MNQVRVLLVEDDEDDYVLTRSLLSEISEEGFILEWVTNYDAAMERIMHNHHDVCLLDYRLGGRNGLDLLREARANGYSHPIILLTGQNDHEVDVEAMKAGASDYLIKGQLNAPMLERSIRYAVEQKRIEEERIQHVREQEARAQAESANRAKDEFLAVVSHELRTPLNTMLGWVQLLRIRKDDADTLTRAIDAIERNARIQIQFVDDLLDITRIDNGNLRLEMRSIELNSIIEPAIEGMRPTADAKNIRLEAMLDNSHMQISGDSDRLQQVINNLLSNAIKFTPNGGRIKIQTECADANAKITVSDTGRGISPDLLPYVFDRYRQADDADTKRQGGLGLGLAISRNIIEIHGGTITAASPGENQGTTFTVILPLVTASESL